MFGPADQTITLKHACSRIDEPELLRAGPLGGTRAVANPFLPDGCVCVVNAFDLSPSDRSSLAAARDVALLGAAGPRAAAGAAEGHHADQARLRGWKRD